jgi:putative transposase
MRGPQPPPITVTVEERRELEALARRHGTAQQIAQRARILLAADDGANNAQIARRLGVNVEMVRLWRTRWRGLGAVPLAESSVAERLGDAHRPGGPCRISAEQVCRIVGLACEAPAASGRPISQWTGREIATEAIRRGIVDTISPRHASRVLKRGTSGPAASATG